MFTRQQSSNMVLKSFVLSLCFKGIMLEFIAIDLDREYFKKYGNFLPPTGKTCLLCKLEYWMNKLLFISLIMKNLVMKSTKTC